jgi:hypothetical protein
MLGTLSKSRKSNRPTVFSGVLTLPQTSSCALLSSFGKKALLSPIRHLIETSRSDETRIHAQPPFPSQWKAIYGEYEMNRKYLHSPRLVALAVLAVAACLLAGNARAGSVEVDRHPSQAQVHMAHSLVVLVARNHLVVRRSSGILQALEIPESFRFHMNGTSLSVHQLKPEMVVAETVTTLSQPATVKAVRVENATVWHANGEHVILSETNGQLKNYRIPGWARIKVDGADLTVFDLRKGMKINATIIAEERINTLEN